MKSISVCKNMKDLQTLLLVKIYNLLSRNQNLINNFCQVRMQFLVALK